jgi:hypothetical protein
MAGYIRQDTLNEIEDAEVIKAEPLDAEFDALVSAFSAASGHKHSGLTGEGAPITVVGPTQNVSVSANSITPSVDDFVDLGSSGNEFKNLYIDGTANIDVLAADAATVGGVAVTTASNTQTLTNKTINLTNNTLVATSAQLAAAVTDETGTGALVFADSPALAGIPTAPTAAAATNTTQVATTAHVFAERGNTATLTNKTINLANNTLVATSAQVAAAVTDETGTGSLVFSASPALTGTPTAPTAVADTNTTQLATTAHVFAERSNTATLTNKTLTSPTINSPTISSPTITGGSITGITALAVADGGTGATNAADARTNLGIVAAGDEQPLDAGLTSISALTTGADTMIYTTALDTYTTTPLTSFGRSILDDVDAAAVRTTIGLGTIATQDAATVAITGGSITGVTDIAIADGGTGASTAAGALTNLGLTATAAELNTLDGITATVTELNYTDGVTSSLQTQLDGKQPLDADLTALAAMSGTGVVVRTAANTYTQRSVTSGDGSVTVTNGNGVAGNIDLSVSTGGVVFLGTITTTSGTSQSLTSLTLTSYKFLRLVFVGVSTNNAAWLLQLDGRTISQSEGTASFLRGFAEIDLDGGTFWSQVADVTTNSSTNSFGSVGDTNITTASTSVTVSTSAGSFDSGAVRVYGIR